MDSSCVAKRTRPKNGERERDGNGNGNGNEALHQGRARRRTANKNINRNKVGFAFDEHRKKAQTKVVTYTFARYEATYASLLPPPRDLKFLVCRSSSRPLLRASAADWLKEKDRAENGRRIADWWNTFRIIDPRAREDPLIEYEIRDRISLVL